MTTRQTRSVGDAQDILMKDEQVRLHASVFPASLVGGAVSGLVVAMVLYGVVAPAVVTVWLVCLGLVLGVRALVGGAQRRAATVPPGDHVWLWRHRLLFAAHGLVWALASLVLFPPGDLTHQTFLTFAVVAICIGSLMINAFDFTAVLLFCTPALVALMSRLLWQGQEVSSAMATAVFLLFLFVGLAAVGAHRSVRENVVLRAAEATRRDSLERSYQRLGRAEQIAHLGSFDWDAVSGELQWSDEVFRLWGLKPGVVPPSHALFIQGVHPDDLPGLEQRLQAALSGGNAYDFIFRVCWPDGSVHDVHGLGEVTFDSSGKAVRMVGTVQDITDRIRGETALAEKHHLLALLLQTTLQGFWFIGVDGVSTDANPAMCALLGRPREEIIGRSVFDFFSGTDLQVLRDEIVRRQTGKKGGYEISITRPDGTRRHCVNNATPIYDSRGNSLGSVGLWTDITVRRQAEMALQTYALVANSVTELISVVGEDGVYRMVNDSWCRTLGLVRENVIGRHMSEIMPLVLTDERQRAMRECFEQHELRVVRGIAQAPWLAGPYVETTYYPYTEDTAGVRCVVIKTRDITEQEDSRQRLSANAENLRRTLNTTTDGMFAYDANDPDGRLLFANDRFFEMWGIPREQAPATGRAEVIVAARKLFADPDLEVQRITEILAMTVSHEDRLVLRDGRVLQRRSVPMQDAVRSTRVWSFRDITIETRALEALHASDDQQRALMDAFPGFIAVMDENFIYSYVNERLAKLFGRPAEQVVGCHMRDIIGEERFGQNARDISGLMQGERTVVERHYAATSDRSRTDLQVTHVIGHGRGGVGTLLYSFGVDITDLKRAEEALLLSRDEAERANRAKSSFVASVSHELRTPLNAILGFSQMLRTDAQLSQAAVDDATEIEHAGQHLLSLVDDLIDLGRVESGHLELTISRVPVEAVINESLSMVATLAAKQGIRIVYAGGDARNAMVMADAVRLRQIIINLLSNAIKYNRKDGTVRVSCVRQVRTYGEKSESLVRFLFKDTGFGIPGDQASRVFSAFDRLGAERGTVEGTGIGLVITKSLVTAMGGSIGYESRVDEGSTFWVDLVQAPGAAAGVRKSGLAVPHLVAPRVNGAVARVLVAEDYVPNQAVLKLQLASLGCKVDVVSDGAAAIASWRAARYDLILTDLDMPLLDGLELTRTVRLREKTRGGHIPIIGLSAAVMGEERLHCLAAGMDDLFAKPIALEGLAAMLERWLGVASRTMMPMPKIVDTDPDLDLDLDQLSRVLGQTDPAQAHALISTFLSAARTGLSELAARAGDAEALLREMHRQRSSALTVGAMHYAELARTLEQAVHVGAVDNVGHWLLRLSMALERVEACLARLNVPDDGPATVSSPLVPSGGSVSASVLVVDDDPVVLMQMKQILAGIGVAEIVTARNGIEAIVLMNLRTVPPQVVVCDLTMPEMDGVEMIRRFGQSGFRGGLILMSGANDQLLTTVRKLAELQGLTVLGQIHKPVTPEAMQALLRNTSAVPAERRLVSRGIVATPEVIRAGIAADEFSVWLQPKVNARTLEPVGVEALARWRQADGSYVPPDLFIVVAEREGIIGELSRVLVAKALKEGARLHAAGFPLKISVNLSAMWLDDLNLPDLMLQSVLAVKLVPADIILEVTETGVAKDMAIALDVLTRLRLKGFGLSIDDFGIGYSSFEQLGRIPFTEMKLDRSFVSRGSKDSAAHAILESSMDMACKLELVTVAEGVETQAELELMRDLGCDAVQGYLIAKPMPIDELIQWLRQHTV